MDGNAVRRLPPANEGMPTNLISTLSHFKLVVSTAIPTFQLAPAWKREHSTEQRSKGTALQR